jgi:hypothetical protein
MLKSGKQARERTIKKRGISKDWDQNIWLGVKRENWSSLSQFLEGDRLIVFESW